MRLSTGVAVVKLAAVAADTIAHNNFARKLNSH